MHLKVLAFIFLILGPFCPVNARSKTEFIIPIDSVKSETETKSISILALPIITFAPETSLQFGVTAIGLYRNKNADPSTHLSLLRTPVSYTLNSQIKVRVSFDIFSNRNDHVFLGFAEWFRFPLLFYGIGNDSSNEDEEIYTTESIAAEFKYLSRIKGKFYLGGTFNFLDSDIIEVEPDGLLSQDGLIPGNQGGSTVGLGILARLDSRDNTYNCSNGLYFQAGFSFIEEVLGSDFDYNVLNLDFRYYLGIAQSRHVLAFQFVMENIWGDPSFETMALFGGGEIMRGHYLGRFRDNSMYAVQAEYRIPLVRSHWVDNREKVPFKERWGLVGFFGFGNVAPSTSDYRLEYTKTSVGFGVRYLAMPKEKLNIRVDFGFGTQFPGIYFNVREAF